MSIQVLTGNALDSCSEALLITVDGTRRGMEGNLARQFERRWPDDWQDMQRNIPYPIPLGYTVALDWDGDSPWSWYLIASTLHHLQVLSDADKITIVKRAFLDALNHCHRLGLRSLATAVMRGGWRLSMEDAFHAMLTAWNASLARHSQLNVQVYVLEDEHQASLAAVLSAHALR